MTRQITMVDRFKQIYKEKSEEISGNVRRQLTSYMEYHDVKQKQSGLIATVSSNMDAIVEQENEPIESSDSFANSQSLETERRLISSDGNLNKRAKDLDAQDTG